MTETGESELPYAGETKGWLGFIRNSLQMSLGNYERHIHSHPQPLNIQDVLTWLSQPETRVLIETFSAEDEESGPVSALPETTLNTLQAVSIVDGRPAEQHIEEAVNAHLARIVLQPTFAGEFADACKDFDLQHHLSSSERIESTHSRLASDVMAFRQQARDRFATE